MYFAFPMVYVELYLAADVCPVRKMFGLKRVSPTPKHFATGFSAWALATLFSLHGCNFSPSILRDSNSPPSEKSRVTNSSRSTTVGRVIPPKLFGLTVTYHENWPTVPFGVLGGNGIRWPSIEQTKHIRNWTTLDAWVALANAHNLPFEFQSSEAPPWAVSDASSCSAASVAGIQECSADVTDLSAWNDFVTTLTQRYNGNNDHGFIQIYELYIEPDNFFKGDMANLVAQTTALYNAVRANSPNALVVGMGVDYPDTYFAPGNYMDKYWAAGGVKTLDAVAFHGYPHHGNDVPEIVNTYVPYVKAAMARNGIAASTPIWDTESSWGDITESGWNVTDPDEQAGWVARSYLLHWSNSVSVLDWYAWDGYPWGALWYATPPPSGLTSGIDEAGVAYGQVYSWMVGAEMSTPCSANGTVWTCGLTKPGTSEALVVWNTAGDSSYTPAARFKKCQDLSGNIRALRNVITIGAKPILLLQ